MEQRVDAAENAGPGGVSIRTDVYELRFSRLGALESYRTGGGEFIDLRGSSHPLLEVRLRDDAGRATDVTSLQAGSCVIETSEVATSTTVRLAFGDLGGLPLQATVTVRCPHQDPCSYWRVSLDNGTPMFVDFIDFPNIVVPNDLVGSGGGARIFRPNIEGVLIEDLEIRKHGWTPALPMEFPTTGWAYGIYPATCSMQFMAYYGSDGRGLYLGAHDVASHVKGIDAYEQPMGGILLKFRLYPGAPGQGSYAMPYDMVLGGFLGDWHDAADIYRTWRETANMPTGPKLKANTLIPEWFVESPTVVVCPVRGHMDRGDMAPNEYFPYDRQIPVMERLAEQFGGKILTLLAQWEGTAPWAPPYTWPPLGGEDQFRDYVQAMHDRGHLVGLYASGLGYTTRSGYNDYNMEAEFAEKNLQSVMTVGPEGTLAKNGACCGQDESWAIRRGYDMCPAPEFVKEVTRQEYAKMLTSGADYVQYFDQNLGGQCYYCYSREHGHPSGPGCWMNDEMIRIFEDMGRITKASGRKVLLGCEEAAAEPFVPYLSFSDLRFPVNFGAGNPVPAYAYVFHEYVNNFMGNQNGVDLFTDIARSPLHLHQRLAYSFVAGDMMTVVLAGGSVVNWAWGIDWDVTMPDQDSIATLIRRFNAWRTGEGKEYLVYGRMEKPYPITGGYDLPMFTPQGRAIHFDSLLTSRWTSQQGKNAQVVANYTTEGQQFQLVRAGHPKEQVNLFKSPYGTGVAMRLDSGGALELEIPAVSALLIEFGPNG